MKDKLSLHEKQYGDELFWDKTKHILEHVG